VTITRVAIGADHSAVTLKDSLVRWFRDETSVVVDDCGTHGTAPVDYPDIAAAVARKVVSGVCERGIVIDAAGIGSSIAANKLHGVRCALCHDEATVRNSRLHNDANLLALGSRVVNPGLARRLIRIWLETAYEGGRHARRVQKISDLEGAR
jgi:ribose 5-phosphate isomerase B